MLLLYMKKEYFICAIVLVLFSCTQTGNQKLSKFNVEYVKVCDEIDLLLKENKLKILTQDQRVVLYKHFEKKSQGAYSSDFDEFNAVKVLRRNALYSDKHDSIIRRHLCPNMYPYEP